MGVIRNHYQFTRPLSASETELLSTLIGWRQGSSVVTDNDAVDVVEFEKRLRRQRAKLEAMILI